METREKDSMPNPAANSRMKSVRERLAGQMQRHLISLAQQEAASALACRSAQQELRRLRANRHAAAATARLHCTRPDTMVHVGVRVNCSANPGSVCTHSAVCCSILLEGNGTGFGAGVGAAKPLSPPVPPTKTRQDRRSNDMKAKAYLCYGML